jgi:hypothetical protein
MLKQLHRLTHGARARRRKIGVQGPCDGFNGRPAKHERRTIVILRQEGFCFHDLGKNLLWSRRADRLVLHLAAIDHTEFPTRLPFEAFTDGAQVLFREGMPMQFDFNRNRFVFAQGQSVGLIPLHEGRKVGLIRVFDEGEPLSFVAVAKKCQHSILGLVGRHFTSPATDTSTCK